MGLGLKSLFDDLGIKLDVEIFTDASAAKGIAHRRGLGKLRHIAVHFLWVQERVACGDIRVSKVWGGINPADILTKYIDRKLLTQHMSTFGVEYLEGRAAGALAVACLTHAVATAGSPISGEPRELPKRAVATKRVTMSPIETVYRYTP